LKRILPPNATIADIERAHQNLVANVDISKVYTAPDPYVVEAKKQLAMGNVAEAYGVSPDAGALGKSGLIDKYGVLPLAGSLLAVLIGKEVIVYNEEFILLFTATLTFGSLWVLGRDSLLKGYQVEMDQTQREMYALKLLEVELLREQIDDRKFFLNIVEDYKKFVSQSVTWLQNVTTNAPEIDRRRTLAEAGEMVKQTNTLYERLRKLERQDFVDKARKMLAIEFRIADQKIKEDFLETAIRAVRRHGTPAPSEYLYNRMSKFAQSYQFDYLSAFQSLVPATLWSRIVGKYPLRPYLYTSQHLAKQNKDFPYL